MAGFCAAYKPADRRPPWAWCEEHLTVDESSPFPGRWRAAHSPWVRAVMEAFADNDVRNLVVQCAAQTANLECECLCAIQLDTRRRATGFLLVAMGTMDSVLSSPWDVVRSAAALVLDHNHPSGCPDPSENGIRVTRDLMRAGQLLKIGVLDHVVVGRPEPDRPRPWALMRELGHSAG